MTKRIILYILSGAWLLTACSTDGYEPEDPTPDRNDALTLTVSASDVVVSNGTISRAAEASSSTKFEVGDRVGLTVLDSKDNLLVDNVPYIFDGEKWDFDSHNTDGKQRPYYDATMSTYIVYFPYTKEANNIKDVDALKYLGAFEHKMDQHDLADFQQSDKPLVDSGTVEKQINAKLKHARNSFKIAARVKWTLSPTGETIIYKPVDKALVNFKIWDDNKTVFKSLPDKIDITYYNADDDSYSFILPNDYEGTISWEYIYRETIYNGQFEVSKDSYGTRYLQNEPVDMGVLKGFNVIESDYYCSTADGIGYVLPWDAEPCFSKDGELRRFVGIVTYVGQNSQDISIYETKALPDGTKAFPDGRCHGYVVALSDVLPEVLGENLETIAWSPDAGDDTKWHTKYVGTRRDYRDWSGYSNHNIIKGIYNGNDTNFEKYFPAAYYCDKYGDKEKKNDLKNVCFAAPQNTSGWFLPSSAMFKYAMQNPILNERFTTIKDNISNNNWNIGIWQNMNSEDSGYWGSNESVLSGYAHVASTYASAKTFATTTSKFRVRAFLAF